MIIKTNKKRNIVIKLIIGTFTFVIAGAIIIYIITNSFEANSGSNSHNNDNYNDDLKKNINKYLNGLVDKNKVANSIYYDDVAKSYQINKDKFNNLYLNAFYAEVKIDYRYNFLNLEFDFSFKQSPELIANVNIQYFVMTKYEENISSSTNVMYSWTELYN